MTIIPSWYCTFVKVAWGLASVATAIRAALFKACAFPVDGTALHAGCGKPRCLLGWRTVALLLCLQWSEELGAGYTLMMLHSKGGERKMSLLSACDIRVLWVFAGVFILSIWTQAQLYCSQVKVSWMDCSQSHIASQWLETDLLPNRSLQSVMGKLRKSSDVLM